MSILDVGIVLIYLVVILFIGGFVGTKKKTSTSNEYFNGGKSMPWWAIGLSVGMTMISANSFIGGPGWGFQDGLIAAMVNISIPLSIVFCTYLVLPVIYDANVTTVYEYVNMRMGTMTRILNVVFWLIKSLILVGGFVYTPALVLAVVSGISTDIWIPVIVVISIVYTIAGGIKAVIWTDAIQGIVMGLGLVISMFVAAGGLGIPLSSALEISREAGLMQSFSFSFDFSTLNVWCAFIGGFAMWIGYFGFGQEQVQRYITAKNMRAVKKTGIMSTIFMQILYWLCFLLGVVLYVFYQHNPNTLDFANANNIMTDFLVNYVPTGVLGILLAATFAAAMSSIDSVLNSLTAVFAKDIYEPYIARNKETPTCTYRIISAVFGVLIVIFVYLCLGESTASILSTIGSLSAPFGASCAGLMLMCIFMPKITDKAAFCGSLISIFISLGIAKVFPAQWLWKYVYGIVLCILISCICSKFFKPTEDELERAYRYSYFGSKKRLAGKTDDSGCSLEPGKMDVYGWVMLAVFVIQCVVLVALQ